MAHVVKQIFVTPPTGCTNCGEVHHTKACHNGYANRPGGNVDGICTHWNGCQSFCLGIYYATFPDGTTGAMAIQPSDVVVATTLYTKPASKAPRTAPVKAKAVCRCPIADLLSQGHAPDCPEKH